MHPRLQRDMAARMGSGAMRGGPPRGGDRGRRDGDYGMAPRGQMGMCVTGDVATSPQSRVQSPIVPTKALCPGQRPSGTPWRTDEEPSIKYILVSTLALFLILTVYHCPGAWTRCHRETWTALTARSAPCPGRPVRSSWGPAARPCAPAAAPPPSSSSSSPQRTAGAPSASGAPYQKAFCRRSDDNV